MTVSMILSFDSGWLEPGETSIDSRRATEPIRFQKIVARLHGQPPELRYFHRVLHKSGGSKRRGRRAAEHWAIATLIAAKRSPIAELEAAKQNVLRERRSLWEVYRR